MNVGKSDNKAVTFPIESLKKHLAVFGGSGSGKTVFSKVVIEEAVKQGLPCILVDSQGDLASFAMNPELKTVVFTPASSKGIPLSINPFKKPSNELDNEELINVVHQTANSIANLLGYKDDDKGNAARSLIYFIFMNACKGKCVINNFEDLINHLKDLPDHLEDKVKDLFSSDKEVKSMIRKLSYLSVGEKDLLFNFGVPLDMKHFLKKGQISIIYLNTLHDEKEKQFFLSMLTTELYQWMLCNPKDTLQVLYYIDEIASYLPAGSIKPLSKPILKLLYKQARKYGVGCIASTQNPGDIDYKAFAQFSSWAIGRLTTRQDISKIVNALKSVAGSKISQISSSLPQLKPGEFMLFSPDNFDQVIELKVRELLSPHKTLNDDSVKKVTSKELRDKFSTYQAKKTKTKSVETKTSEGVSHIPISLREPQAYDLVDKKKKKLFILLGPHKENIESMQLTFEPLYKAKVKSLKKGLLGKKVNEHTILFNAVSGNPLRSDYKECEHFNQILNLSSNEVSVLKSFGSKPLSSHDLAAKTNLNTQSVSAALNGLSKKRLVTKDGKAGKSQLWSVFTALSIPTLNKLTFPIKTSSEHVDAKTMKPKVEVEKLGKSVNNWFGASEIVEHELIYLPVYDVVLSSKKGKRHLKINASNGKVIER